MFCRMVYTVSCRPQLLRVSTWTEPVAGPDPNSYESQPGLGQLQVIRGVYERGCGVRSSGAEAPAVFRRPGTPQWHRRSRMRRAATTKPQRAQVVLGADVILHEPGPPCCQPRSSPEVWPAVRVARSRGNLRQVASEGVRNRNPPRTDSPRGPQASNFVPQRPLCRWVRPSRQATAPGIVERSGASRGGPDPPALRPVVCCAARVRCSCLWAACVVPGLHTGRGWAWLGCAGRVDAWPPSPARPAVKPYLRTWKSYVAVLRGWARVCVKCSVRGRPRARLRSVGGGLAGHRQREHVEESRSGTHSTRAAGRSQ
jgi:hypothetical protein